MTQDPKQEIHFQSYNPYEARYPGLRVVSRETLHLIKLMREAGYHVIIEPEDGTDLHYLAEKGLREILADPIVAMIIWIPLTIILNLLSNWLSDVWRRPPLKDEVQLVLVELDEFGNKLRYSQSGQPISEERFQAILKSLDDRANRYKESQQVATPISECPYPIYLEHTSKIVGWAERFVRDEKGLGVDGVRIVDPEIESLIEDGYITGFSYGGIIKGSTCSICDGEYVSCNHIACREYKGKECLVRIDDFLIAELSLVKDPIQPLARIKKRPRIKDTG